MKDAHIVQHKSSNTVVKDASQLEHHVHLTGVGDVLRERQELNEGLQQNNTAQVITESV